MFSGGMEGVELNDVVSCSSEVKLRIRWQGWSLRLGGMVLCIDMRNVFLGRNSEDPGIISSAAGKLLAEGEESGGFHQCFKNRESTVGCLRRGRPELAAVGRAGTGSRSSLEIHPESRE